MVLAQACQLFYQYLCSTIVIVLTMLRSTLLVCFACLHSIDLEQSQSIKFDQQTCLLLRSKNLCLTCLYDLGPKHNYAFNSQFSSANLVCIKLSLGQVYPCLKDHVHHKPSRSKTHVCSHSNLLLMINSAHNDISLSKYTVDPLLLNVAL